jgi:hypothetical protein
MCYRDELQAIFHPKDFSAPGSNTRSPKRTVSDTPSFELTYCPKKRGMSASSLTPAKSLILSCLRSRVATIPRPSITVKQLLHFISKTWDVAHTLEEEMRLLQFNGVTKAILMEKEGAESSLRARCILLGDMTQGEEQRHARIDVDFIVTPQVGRKGRRNSNGNAESDDKLELDIDVALSKVYGFGDGSTSTGLSESKMRDIIMQNPALMAKGKKKRVSSELISGPGLGHGVWGQAVRDLAGRVFS